MFWIAGSFSKVFCSVTLLSDLYVHRSDNTVPFTSTVFLFGKCPVTFLNSIFT